MSKRICVMTNFTSHDNAYSLCNVVSDQLKMILSTGKKPVLMVQESGYWKDPKNYENLPHSKSAIFTLPAVACHNEVKIDPTFQEDVDKLEKSMEIALENVDVVLTHDVIYQPAAMKHLVAARRIAEKRPEIKWYHWIHSATSPYTLTTELKIFQDAYIDNIRTKFPNSKYVFFNHLSIPRIAQNFGIKEEDVAIVHHPTDVYEFMRIDDEVREFSEKYKILEADYMTTYPARLDRGKNLEMVIKTMASLKKLGQKVVMVVMDFHSTGGDKLVYRDDLKKLGKDWGLTEDELVWTSEFKPEWKSRVPRGVVSQLMSLANVFIMPSRSESYSLVTQEAALYKAIIVANEDFLPFKDILGPDVIWRKYSSGIDRATIQDGETNTTYNNEEMYHLETAMMIQSQATKSFGHSQFKRVKQTRNLNYILNNELLPLIS